MFSEMKSVNIAVIAGDGKKSRVHRAPLDGAPVTAITLENPKGTKEVSSTRTAF